MSNLTNKYNISISGLNLHHVIAYFEQEKFLVSNLSRKDHKTLTCTILKKDYKKFKKSGLFPLYQIKILKTHGADNLANKFVQNIGLIVGIIICFCSVLAITNNVYSISFNNQNHTCTNLNDCIFTTENQTKLLSVLKENNIFVGANIKQLPSNKILEQILMKEFKQISGVSLSRKGTRVNIEIVEAKLLSPATTNSLVAKESGIIINLDITSGQTTYKPGDIVLKGQTIVSPENNKPVVAKAVLRAFYHDSIIYNENQTTYVKTGRTISKNNLSLWNLKLNSKATKKFKLYESETHNRYAFLNMFLPVKINQTIFYELEKHETIIPFSDVESTLKSNLKNTTLTHVPTDAEIKNTTFSSHIEGSRTRLDCYIETYLTIIKS